MVEQRNSVSLYDDTRTFGGYNLQYPSIILFTTVDQYAIGQLHTTQRLFRQSKGDSIMATT